MSSHDQPTHTPSSKHHDGHAKVFAGPDKKYHNNYDKLVTGGTASIFAQSLPLFLGTNPITPDSNVLDNACGTGAVTEVVKVHCPPVPITGADVAPGMLELFKNKADIYKWENTQTKVQDIRDLDKCGDEMYSHVFTNFALAPLANDLEGPAKAAREMYRVLERGGVCVTTIWLHNVAQLLQQVAKKIRPDKEPLSWSIPKDWNKGWWLMKLLDEGGFGNDVDVKRAVTEKRARNLDELVESYMYLKDMHFKSYSEEEIERLPVELKKELPLSAGYFEDGDGVGIVMTAWVGVARKL